jgi:hypothetical protein
MASVIEDVSSLPGEMVKDQEGRKVGEVKEIYAVGEDETPMWVTIESQTGIGHKRLVFVPLARLKQEAEEIRVPYSFQHLQESPEVEPGDEISAEDDRALRNYYAVGLADQEMVSNAQSYASQQPDERGEARRVEASAVEGPVREIEETPPAELAAEADQADRKEKERNGGEDRKQATAADVLGDQDGENDNGD